MSAPGLTIAGALRRGESELAAASDTPHLDASVLLRHAGGYSTADLIARAGDVLPEKIQACYEALIRERGRGRPVAHLAGRREFWSLELAITPEALIPRPETELLVEAALGLVPVDADWRLADLGTGSGAVALALAHERPRCRVIATDLSAAALQVAESNRAALGLENVDLRLGSWFEPLGGQRVRLLVSNPPYVAADDPHLDRGDVRFEPRMALAAGDDGLDAIRHIVARAPDHLSPGGWLLLEHGWRQGDVVLEMLREDGFEQTETLTDLAGLSRVARGRCPE